MYIVSHSTTAYVDKRAVWAIWKDVDNWAHWDEGLEKSRLIDCFEKGGQAELYPIGKNPVIVSFISVDREKEFSDEADIEFAKIATFHTLESLDDKVKITHKIVIHPKNREGEAIIAHQLYPALSEGLPRSVEKLVQIAETSGVS